MDSRARPGVVVLGMHRSGTSAVTQLLHHGGLSSGRDRRLDRGGPANPRGFWEVQALTRMDERILHALDGEWSAPPELQEGWERDQRLAVFRREAHRIFTRRMSTRDTWVWKDPRLCLTLPFWRSLGVEVGAVVLVTRNPLEVAMSLRVRNGFDVALGLALWEHYTRAALEVTRDVPTAIVDLDTVAADAPTWTRDTVAWLRDLRLDPGPWDPERIAGVFDPSLRHARRTLDELRSEGGIAREQVVLYGWLHEMQGRYEALPVLPEMRLEPNTSHILAERRRLRGDVRRRLTSRRRRIRRRAVTALVDVRDVTRSLQRGDT